jgi:5-methylcytosine-specific restriction endonuclease McrA
MDRAGVFIPASVLSHERVTPKYKLWLMQEGRCRWCGEVMRLRGPGPDVVTIDHVIPRSKGGSDDIDNLVGACRLCNNRRGDTV